MEAACGTTPVAAARRAGPGHLRQGPVCFGNLHGLFKIRAAFWETRPDKEDHSILEPRLGPPVYGTTPHMADKYTCQDLELGGVT